MSLDYHRCAKEILRYIGGKRNLLDGTHCSTRLRLEIANEKKINMTALENIEGVKGVYFDDGLLQVILGNGTVERVFDDFKLIAGLQSKKPKSQNQALDVPVFKKILRTPGNALIPLLPVIMGCGFFVGIIRFLPFLGENFTGTSFYQLLKITAEEVLLFMPVLVSASTAIQNDGNVYMALLVSLCMLHLAGTGNFSSFIFSGLNSTTYTGRILPFVATIILMCTIEKNMRNRLPDNLRIYVSPLVTFVLTLVLGVGIVGPIFCLIEESFVNIASYVFRFANGIPASFLLGACYPLSVMGGWHHLLIIIEMGMLVNDFGSAANILMPMISAANFAQFGAASGVALKSSNPKTKAKAIPAAVSAAFGITEPALYGVSLHYKYPLYFSMIAGGLGALYGALNGIGAYAFEISGITGYLIVDKPLPYTILLIISGGIACGLTFLFWKEKNEEETVLFTLDGDPVYSPVRGKKIPASEIPDPLFAEAAMGPTVGVLPEDGVVYAPFDAHVEMVFPTKHAIGLKRHDGLEMLIHIGVDTAVLGEKAFKAMVESGSDVHEGDILIQFDRNRIAEANCSEVVIVILTNTGNALKIE